MVSTFVRIGAGVHVRAHRRPPPGDDVRIANARDLGHYVRESRRRLGQTQADLAAAAHVSRRWLTALEAGKPTAAIGLVFQTLSALGVVLDAQPGKRTPDQFDLDEHLERYAEPMPAESGLDDASW
jgi:HTH-type transcriptional regulator / antitoxin HipB